MATKNFRVRNGIEVGPAAGSTNTFTIDGATGNIVTAGTLDVQGGTVTDSTGALQITTASNGNLTLAPNGTGDVILSADTIQVGDNASPATITTQGQASLTINAGNGTGTDVAGSNTIIQAGNGTGTGGSGSIVLRTAPTGSTSSTANTMADVLTLAAGANGAITLDPNGTGNIVLTLANGGNLTNDRNYLRGTVGDVTVLDAGDILGFTNGAGTDYRGILLTNEDDTTKAPGVILRGFTGSASAQPLTRPLFAFERARGTVGSPTALQNNDILGGFAGNGFTTGGWLRDVAAATYFPAVVNLTATENWISNTNVGTNFAVLTMPTATPFTGTNQQATIAANPQVSQIRSDLVNIRDKISNSNYVSMNGTFNFDQPLGVTANMLSTTANAGASVGITTRYRQGFIATGSSISGFTLTVGTVTGGTGPATGQALYGTGVAVGTTITANISGSGSGSTWTVSTSQTTASTTISGFLNTALTVPQSGNKLGNFRFNSNSDTAGTFVLSAQVLAEATENWGPTANGSRITFFANKKLQSWTTGLSSVISASPEDANISSDIITLESSAGTDYAVFNSTSAKFATPVRTTITSATVAKGGTYTPAVTAMNSIILEITAGSGTTTIDVSNLTVASENAVFDIMVYNNSGGSINSNALVIINNGNTALDHSATISNGARAMFEVNCVDIYANAKYAGDAV